MDSLKAYFDMDGYAAFVWPSYAVAAIVLVALFFSVLARVRAGDRALQRLEEAGAGRRRRRRPEEDSPAMSPDGAVSPQGDQGRAAGET